MAELVKKKDGKISLTKPFKCVSYAELNFTDTCMSLIIMLLSMFLYLFYLTKFVV